MLRHKCIIIDDEPEVRKRMENLLNKIGNVDIIASEGEPEDAIKAVIEKKPDIVFIDIELPRINGFEVIEEIRKNDCYPTFIFVTAYNQYAIKAIKNAAFDFILKPVEIDELSRSISRFTDKLKVSISSIIEHSKYESLSNREKEILGFILKGFTSREIANKLFISKNTVDTHRRKILEKLQVKNTIDLLSLK